MKSDIFLNCNEENDISFMRDNNSNKINKVHS